MKSFILCAICLHLAGGYVYGSRLTTISPDADTDGVGVFAYQDSTGNRYGGTYGLKDGQVIEKKGTFPPNFSPPNFQDFDDFFPDYFKNLENVLQEIHPYFPPPTFTRPPSFIHRPYTSNSIFNRTFKSSVDQNLAFDAARKAFDLTSNQAGYIPNFASRFQDPFANFGSFGGFENMPGSQGFPGFPGFRMPDFGRDGDGNSAYASAAIGPEISVQRAGINPANPNNPNIDKVHRVVSSGPGNYNSVSSSSRVSSAIGPDGKQTSSRSAQTTVNNNGDITTYKVGN